MFVGLTNRGWSSLGAASYGLQRLVWSGKTPFEIKEMRATKNGFDLVFTKPVDPATATNPQSYSLQNYTYLYHSTYGSDEIQTKRNTISKISLSDDHRTVKLQVEDRRELYVHQLVAKGVRSQVQESLLHPEAYYTLNRIPK